MKKKTQKTVNEIGSMGGKATAERYGVEYMREIASRGGQKSRNRGRDYYSKIGKISAAKRRARKEKKSGLDDVSSFLSGKLK